LLGEDWEQDFGFGEKDTNTYQVSKSWSQLQQVAMREGAILINPNEYNSLDIFFVVVSCCGEYQRPCSFIGSALFPGSEVFF
jgi:hypothetical protein